MPAVLQLDAYDLPDRGDLLATLDGFESRERANEPFFGRLLKQVDCQFRVR